MRGIDREELRTQRAISKWYNDALQAAIRKSRLFLQRARDVQSGKIKPPPGLTTDAQIDGWKRGYMTRAAKQYRVIENIAQEMEQAGVRTRKRIQQSMSSVYQMARRNTTQLLDKIIPANLPELSRREIELLLYQQGKAGAFSKVALAHLGDNADAVKRLRTEFALGIQRNENADQLIERIRRVTGMELNDAKRVLRTETTHIENLAQQEAAIEHWRKTGVKPFKKWVCMFRNSRESHMAMDGQTVPIDEDFILPSGQPISYPGDSKAGPEEVCNCQCRMEIVPGGK